MECVIPQKFHRSIMGPKGSRIQGITRDHNVQIKFPERVDGPGKGGSAGKATCLSQAVFSHRSADMGSILTSLKSALVLYRQMT